MFSKKRSIILSLLVIVLVVTSGCSIFASSGKEEPTPTPIPPPPEPDRSTYTVKRGTVVDSLSFTGRVAPAVEEELYFREDGRVKEVYVKRDDVVEAGDLLAELENDDLVRQLRQAETELEVAQLDLQDAQRQLDNRLEKARIDLEIQEFELADMRESLDTLELDVKLAEIELEKTKAGPSPEEVAVARHNLEKAKNSLWSAQISRDSTCGQTKGASCDSAQAAVNRAEEDVRIAEIRLQELLEGPSEEDITVAEVKYERTLQQRRKLERDIAVKERQIALAKMELAELEEEEEGGPKLRQAVERNELAVERLQARVADTRVESPIDGKVSSVSAYEGRTVNAYQTVFVVADDTELEVTAEPMSSQLERLSEGLSASLILSDYPGQELPAEIVQLPYPYGSGGGAEVEEGDDDDRTRISFDPQDLDIGPGDLVKVIVTLEEKEDALWLPPAAIRTFSGRKFAVVEEEGRQRRVDVTLGIESSDRVEIEEGLEEGQVVVGQ
ncbi:MAG: HlyD family efflux transporter periplasmic adaptor subunit [Anaerolineae bacterium]